MSHETTPLPGGDYCILELFGHTTLVGRYREVEQFGVKMMAIEPLFQDTLLPASFYGGAAIYGLTKVEPETARKHQPMHGYQLPPAVKANVPPALLPSTDNRYREVNEDEDEDDDDEDDGRIPIPF